MKKLLCLLLAALALFTLAACGAVDEPAAEPLLMPDYTNELTGLVLRCTNGEVLLLTESSGAVILGGDMNFEGLETGDRLTVYCDDIAETFPAQTVVKEMTLMSHGSLEDLPSDQLEELAALGYEPEP